MIYFFKRKYKQIKNVFRWLPIIWNQFDFDYSYSIEVFKFQLMKMADFMETDKAKTVSAKESASRIRMVLRLMEKVYNEDYGMEYQKKLVELYGEKAFEFNFVDTGDGSGSSHLKYGYELTETPEKIKEIYEVQYRLSEESRKKQKRAHKLLWKLIEHNIQGWWD